MRLHPVTWLIIFAITLRLATDAIGIANILHGYVQFGEHTGSLRWYWPTYFAVEEREVATAVAYVAVAVMVEGLSRVWKRLRSERLAAGGAER